ncbi:MAG: PepSY domain-containing protein, partial [Clostridiales bacterium]|nr:PepSY domain-containing protein [Clostridiales bacterium]
MKNNTNTRKNHIPGVHILSEKTRKTILMAACTASLFALLSAGSAYAAENSSENTVIGAEAAQNYAFADAGVDPVSASSVFTEYDYDDGQFVYEVEFTAEGTEYEYQIQAYDGSVLKKSTEYVSLINSAAASANADTSITLDKAKEIALNDADLVEKAWNDETSENSAEDV